MTMRDPTGQDGPPDGRGRIRIAVIPSIQCRPHADPYIFSNFHVRRPLELLPTRFTGVFGFDDIVQLESVSRGATLGSALSAREQAT